MEGSGLRQKDILLRGLAVMKAFSESRCDGLLHLGFTSDSARLDRRIVNVLPNDAAMDEAGRWSSPAAAARA